MRENSATDPQRSLDVLVRRIDLIQGRVAATIAAMATDPEMIWPALDLVAAGDHLHQAAVAIENAADQLSESHADQEALW